MKQRDVAILVDQQPWLLFILVFAFAPIAGIGRAAEQKAPPAKIFTEGDVEVAWQRRVPELRIDQVPLGEVARQLHQRDFFPEVNFIVPPSARDATVPSIDLRSVTLDDILTAIELASERTIRVNVHGETVTSVDATGLPVARRAATAMTNLVAFTFAAPPVAVAQDENVPICRVFSLFPYLAYKSEEDAALAVRTLYEALDDAWMMLKKQVRDVRAPDLKIHSGTRLLIAVGRERELAVIEQVIRELPGLAPSRKVAAGDEGKAATARPPNTTGNKQ